MLVREIFKQRMDVTHWDSSHGCHHQSTVTFPQNQPAYHESLLIADTRGL